MIHSPLNVQAMSVFQKCCFLLLLTSATAIGVPKLSLHNKETGGVQIITGNECPYGKRFKSPQQFTCACLTGIWAVYSKSCQQPRLLGSVEERCILLNMKVEKVHLLSSSSSLSQTASVFTDNMKTLKGRIEVDDDSNVESIAIKKGSSAKIVLSGNSTTNWGMDSLHKCIKRKSNAKGICSYYFEAANATKLHAHCQNPSDDVVEINAEKCVPYITAHSPECISFVKRPMGRSMGRIFMKGKIGIGNGSAPAPAPGPDAAGNGTKLEYYHEDTNLTVNMTYPEMNSQIWNYLTSKAMEILNLSMPKVHTTLTPTYKFLDISKQIIQKSCPDHYVKDGYFDLALQTFMTIQRKNFDFNDAFSDDPARQRIEDSLHLCLQNISQYPFINPLNRTVETCNQTIEMGMFEKFGKQINLNVSWDTSARGREPLIETVWKIFTHAHAACYKHFENAGFNDHHRFTSLMMTIFTNGINDLWKSMSDVSEETYSGLLGDPTKIMDAVTYCAEYPKLESEYPWELSRPEREISQRRRKRDVEEDIEAVCLQDGFSNDCQDDSTIAVPTGSKLSKGKKAADAKPKVPQVAPKPVKAKPTDEVSYPENGGGSGSSEAPTSKPKVAPKVIKKRKKKAKKLKTTTSKPKLETTTETDEPTPGEDEQ